MILAFQSEQLVNNLRNMVETGTLFCIKEAFHDIAETVNACEESAKNTNGNFEGELSTALHELRRNYDEAMFASGDLSFAPNIAQCTKISEMSEDAAKVPNLVAVGTHTTYTPHDENDIESISENQILMTDIITALDEFESSLRDIVYH
jgi:hypothetical protein